MRPGCRLRFSARAAQVIIVMVMVAGYAWAIYYDLPFFTARSNRRRWLISTGLAVLPVALTAGCLLLALMQMFQDYRLAKFPSPTFSQNEVWFMDGGFLDRDLMFFAKPAGQKPQRLANLCWFPDCDFSSMQWSKDGQIIVCSVKAKTAGNKPVMAIAFDFSKNRPMMPLWMTGGGFQNAPEPEWKKQDAAIRKIIAAHGGFGDEEIDDNILRSREKHPWFWQLPKL